MRQEALSSGSPPSVGGCQLSMTPLPSAAPVLASPRLEMALLNLNSVLSCIPIFSILRRDFSHQFFFCLQFSFKVLITFLQKSQEFEDVLLV